jgi:hypothetical protein
LELSSFAVARFDLDDSCLNRLPALSWVAEPELQIIPIMKKVKAVDFDLIVIMLMIILLDMPLNL